MLSLPRIRRPILPFVSGPKSGGFQLWGLPESGKTSAAMVAGSSEGVLSKTKNRFVVQRRVYDGGKGNKNQRWVHAFNPELCDDAREL